MNFTECDVTAVLPESREACKPMRKLGMLRKTVDTHSRKELRHLRGVENLATWRRSIDFDRCDLHDGQWIHSPLPPTREETTVTMWADVNALKKEISMLEKDRSKQRVENFMNELEQGTANLMDGKFTRLEERMIIERRGRAAAHVVVAPIGTAQLSNPRSRCSEVSCDVNVCMKGNTKGRMDSEPDELEPSSAGTGQLESPSASTSFEAPEQQCLSNWEMEQTSTVDGCLFVGVSSNLGQTIFSLEELVIDLPKDMESDNKER